MSRAVIFDLWRTLVPLTAGHKEAAMAGTAAALESDTPAFRAAWARTRAERETTLLPDYVTGLREAVGASWSSEQMRRAQQARFEAHYAAFADLRPDARPVLVELRRRGHRLGLVSNCSSDVRAMLSDAGLLPLFDVVVLSAEAGVMKPDPRIFRKAMTDLGVESGHYVGDGDDGELDGAREAGLVDVLLDLGEGRSASHRVASLTDVLGVVEGARS